MTDIRSYREAVGALRRNAWRLRVALAVAEAELEILRRGKFPEGHPGGSHVVRDALVWGKLRGLETLDTIDYSASR